MKSLLTVTDLAVTVGEHAILRGVTFSVGTGEVVVLMGPNGSGKSTIAATLAGHPSYTVERGDVLFNGVSLLDLPPEKRARAGLFLAWQYPQTVAGVSLGSFLRLAYNATHEEQLSVKDFMRYLRERMDLLGLPREFMQRGLNEGFSGGEKKRAEMLQLAVLQPRLAILDETDSGLDVDAVQVVGQALSALKEERPDLSLLIITHHQRLVEAVPPQRVLIMHAGRIVKEGEPTLLDEVTRSGFNPLISKCLLSLYYGCFRKI